MDVTNVVGELMDKYPDDEDAFWKGIRKALPGVSRDEVTSIMMAFPGCAKLLGISEELLAFVKRSKAWRESGVAPTQSQINHLERTSVELGGPIPARFKRLQYLNKKRPK